MSAPSEHDLLILADLRRLLEAAWPDGWKPAWGPAPRPEDLRKLLGYTHPLHEPATYRGMTGKGSDGSGTDQLHFGLSLMTLDGQLHQFVLTDIDLRRLANDIVDRLPGWFGHQVADAIDDNVAAGHLAWTEGAQRTGFQPETRGGSRSSAETDCGGSALDANNTSRAP